MLTIGDVDIYYGGGVDCMYRVYKEYTMEDMVEEIIFEIIKTSDPRDAAALVTNVIYDVESGHDIMDSLNKNCEVMFE